MRFGREQKTTRKRQISGSRWKWWERRTSRPAERAAEYAPDFDRMDFSAEWWDEQLRETGEALRAADREARGDRVGE